MSYETVMELSDKKVRLNQYSFFKQGILDYVEGELNQLRLKPNSQLKTDVSFQGHQQPEKFGYEDTLLSPTNDLHLHDKISKAILYIGNMTKVVHLSILNYLSLFREHKDKRLTVEGIESIVNSIKVIWIGIEEGKKSFLKENESAQKINTLFSVKRDCGDD
ncbi:hypothetical protein H4Q26_016210 [Puccinia striiformis f. sp. tritici PST-130]|nr:hypothetical protein H4Q26_016210 [Puccinia striiformis f. sp. tritici PST-130]